MPPIADENRKWPFAVWDGEGLEYDYWCDTLFLPNTVDANMLFNIFSCDWLFKNQWTSLSRAHFSDAMSKIESVLGRVHAMVLRELV